MYSSVDSYIVSGTTLVIGNGNAEIRPRVPVTGTCTGMCTFARGGVVVVVVVDVVTFLVEDGSGSLGFVKVGGRLS